MNAQGSFKYIHTTEFHSTYKLFIIAGSYISQCLRENSVSNLYPNTAT